MPRKEITIIEAAVSRLLSLLRPETGLNNYFSFIFFHFFHFSSFFFFHFFLFHFISFLFFFFCISLFSFFLSLSFFLPFSFCLFAQSWGGSCFGGCI